ncbi:TOPRIM nucleotidyl transferase/hydrolase domain-containing protein [Pseudonocardia sichuanensis]
MTDTRTVVLVEGASDESAVAALARRRCRDLAAEGIALVAMGGATNIGAHLRRFGPSGRGLRLAGLCDAGEERGFRRGLERAGLGTDLDRDDLEALGFFVCVADLEDELIRALGTDAVERVVAAHGELGSFRTLQKQPAWRGNDTHDQLRRFMGSGSGRKIRYSAALVAALDLDRVPRPLDMLLAHLSPGAAVAPQPQVRNR